MAENSREQKKQKKAEKKKLKLEKARAWNLEALEKSTQIDGSTKLPPSVATNPEIKEFDTNNPFVLNFGDYQLSACEIDQLDRTKANKLIGKFQEATSLTPRTLSASNFVRDDVINAGDYSSLYRGLSQDIQLKEAYLAGPGRLIFYFLNNTIYVRAILSTHRRT